MAALVVTSAANSSRLERARAWLDARATAEEVVILAASLDAANGIARERTQNKGSAFGWHRLTIAQLAKSFALAELTVQGLVSVSQLGARAIVARLIHRLKTEGRLGRFAPVANTPGFPCAIAEVISELRLARLSPDDLAAVAPDVAPLLAAYQTELVETHATDWAGVLAIAAERTATQRLSGLPILMLDVPITNKSEVAFLRSLAACAPVLATVPAAVGRTIGWLCDELHWTVEAL